MPVQALEVTDAISLLGLSADTSAAESEACGAFSGICLMEEDIIAQNVCISNSVDTGRSKDSTGLSHLAIAAFRGNVPESSAVFSSHFWCGIIGTSNCVAWVQHAGTANLAITREED